MQDTTSRLRRDLSRNLLSARFALQNLTARVDLRRFVRSWRAIFNNFHVAKIHKSSFCRAQPKLCDAATSNGLLQSGHFLPSSSSFSEKLIREKTKGSIVLRVLITREIYEKPQMPEMIIFWLVDSSIPLYQIKSARGAKPHDFLKITQPTMLFFNQDFSSIGSAISKTQKYDIIISQKFYYNSPHKFAFSATPGHSSI